MFIPADLKGLLAGPKHIGKSFEDNICTLRLYVILVGMNLNCTSCQPKRIHSGYRLSSLCNIPAAAPSTTESSNNVFQFW